MLVKDTFTPAPAVNVLINIGALFDIPTGEFIEGKYGDMILNGGQGLITGIAGPGNFYKSTIMNYMNISAASKIAMVTETEIKTYDTEMSVHEGRLFNLTQRFNIFKDKDILRDGTWTVVNKTQYLGDPWFEITKKYCKDKVEAASKISIETPFLNRDRKTHMKIITPTFGMMDSFTEFQTSDVAGIMDDNALGESGGNTVHMRQGLAKYRLLMELPIVTANSYHYLSMSAHIGKKIEMATGPMPVAPTKKLQHLKNGDVFKGTTDKFTFLTNNCWHAFNAQPMMTKEKTVEFPKNPDDNVVGDLDLNRISLRQLRGKSGPTGVVLDIVVSQSEGVLPELTEFCYLKSMKFGFGGNDRNYFLHILPDVSLSRTTVRRKLDTDPVLARAMNLTSEICQMYQYYRWLDRTLVCDMDVLYQDLINLGYDWNILLNSRSYWLPNDYEQPVGRLTAYDLLRIRVGKYHPYWYPVKREDLVPKTPLAKAA